MKIEGREAIPSFKGGLELAKYRQVHVSFWQDSFVLDLPPEEKYFYLYLMTNSKTTQCGIYELPLKVVEMETGLSSDRIFELLHKFVEYKKILYNEKTREVMLLNWLKHNNLKSPKVMTCAIKEISEVKHIPFIKEFIRQCEVYGYSIDRVSIDYLYQHKLGQHPYGEEKEEEEEKEKEKEEEREGKESALPPLSNPHIDHIHNLCKKCNIAVDNLFILEQIASFVGCVDLEVVEAAIKKSSGKTMNYALGTLKGMVERDGITKKEQLYEKPKIKQASSKPKIQAVTEDVGEAVTDEEFERILRKVRKIEDKLQEKEVG